MLLVLKDANGKAIEPLNKKEYTDFIKDVKKRERLRNKKKMKPYYTFSKLAKPKFKM